MTYSYDLKILMVLVEDVLNGIQGTGQKHFNVKFFLSMDDMNDEMDVDFEMPLSADQENELAVSILSAPFPTNANPMIENHNQ